MGRDYHATTTARPFPGRGLVLIRWRRRFVAAFAGSSRSWLEAELAAVLQRGRYDRRGAARGHRHGHRERRPDRHLWADQRTSTTRSVPITPT